MASRIFDIIEPANETELGSQIRKQALAERALLLIAIEKLSELDSRRGLAEPEEIAMRFEELHLGDTDNGQLPYILGRVTRLSKQTQGEGRLEVTGAVTDPEKDRKLILHVEE